MDYRETFDQLTALIEDAKAERGSLRQTVRSLEISRKRAT
jgi:hypothetical protein